MLNHLFVSLAVAFSLTACSTAPAPKSVRLTMTGCEGKHYVKCWCWARKEPTRSTSPNNICGDEVGYEKPLAECVKAEGNVADQPTAVVAAEDGVVRCMATKGYVERGLLATP